MRDRLIIFGVAIFTSFVIMGCPPVNLTPSAALTTVISTTPTLQPTVTAAPQPAATPTTQVASGVLTSTFEVRHIIVTGVGLAPSTETDPAVRERAAIRAAEVVAESDFAEWIAGAHLESVIVIDKGVETEDVIRKTVNATIHELGNTTKQEYDNNTGKAQVTVEYVVNVPK